MMILFFPVLLLMRVGLIFGGFTFTDAADYLPLLSLLLGLGGAALVRGSRREEASRPFVGMMVVLSLWPILPNLGLLLLARELQALKGSWPQVMVDDPKNWFNHVSPRYDALFHAVSYLEALSGAWMVVFFALLMAARHKLARRDKQLVLACVLFTLFVFVLDPGCLYEWWLD